jgi:prepilin-type N-terminal cleavage/methylation domain-containing protein
VTCVTGLITKAQCPVMELSCFDPPPPRPYDDSQWGDPRKQLDGHSTLAMGNCISQKKRRGFTLLELLIVVSVIAVLGALTVPRMVTAVNDVRLRFVASDLSGLLQSARMQAVRTNVAYSTMRGTLAGGTPIYYINTPGTAYSVGNTIVTLNPNVTVVQGPGSGAPNETTFLASLNFAVDPAADAPSFSPRGLPCIGSAPCNPILGQGFVMFLSQPGILGNIPWAAVVVNPSSHIQVWSCNSAGTWVQRD